MTNDDGLNKSISNLINQIPDKAMETEMNALANLDANK